MTIRQSAKKDAKKHIPEILNTLREYYKGVSMLGSFTDKTPFQILVATALSARAKDSMTILVVKDLFAKYPDVYSLSSAPINKLEKLVKRTGFYKTKAKRIKDLSNVLIERHSGEVPQTMEELVELPGVGRKTAGCVLVYAFGKDAIPVDTHVHKVSNRLGWVKTGMPEETEKALINLIPKKFWTIVNEVLVLHGQNTCSPISPWCSRCPIEKFCPKIDVSRTR